MSWEDDAYLDYTRMIKRGTSPAEASRITGYFPPKVKKTTSKTTFRNFMSRMTRRQYLKVPFAQKEEAKKHFKEMGIPFAWDPDEKKWYIEVDSKIVHDPASGPAKDWIIRDEHGKAV